MDFSRTVFLESTFSSDFKDYECIYTITTRSLISYFIVNKTFDFKKDGSKYEGKSIRTFQLENKYFVLLINFSNGDKYQITNIINKIINYFHA